MAQENASRHVLTSYRFRVRFVGLLLGSKRCPCAPDHPLPPECPVDNQGKPEVASLAPVSELGCFPAHEQAHNPVPKRSIYSLSIQTANCPHYSAGFLLERLGVCPVCGQGYSLIEAAKLDP
jgi:hypothetical protein